MAKATERASIGAAEGTLILGSAARARRLFDEFTRNDRFSRVHLAEYGELDQLSGKGDPSRIVLADPESEGREAIAERLLDLKFRGVKIETAVDSFERLSRKIWLEGLSAEWLVLANGFSQSKTYLACKRLFDIILSLFVLILTLPVALVIAVAIKLESPGAILFRQER